VVPAGALPSTQPKRHHDQFGRFAGLITVTDGRQTDHATQSVTIGRTAVKHTQMWPAVTLNMLI